MHTEEHGSLEKPVRVETLRTTDPISKKGLSRKMSVASDYGGGVMNKLISNISTSLKQSKVFRAMTRLSDHDSSPDLNSKSMAQLDTSRATMKVPTIKGTLSPSKPFEPNDESPRDCENIRHSFSVNRVEKSNINTFVKRMKLADREHDSLCLEKSMQVVPQSAQKIPSLVADPHRSQIVRHPSQKQPIQSDKLNLFDCNLRNLQNDDQGISDVESSQSARQMLADFCDKETAIFKKESTLSKQLMSGEDSSKVDQSQSSPGSKTAKNPHKPNMHIDIASINETPN
jgi:hypothetical protein